MTEVTRASEVLSEALKLIDKPEKWITGVDHGKRCIGPASYINCYCARGAVREVANSIKSPRLFNKAIGRLVDAIPSTATYTTVTGFNDSRTTKHRNIVAWFKRAIAKAKKAGT